MKRFIFLILVSLFIVSINSNAAYKTASQTLYQLYFEGPSADDYVATAQNITTGWVVIGTASNVDVRGANVVGLWVDLDINDSTNARVRALARHTSEGDTFLFPIKTVGASDVKVEDEYFEFNSDSDQRMLLTWDIDRLISYIDFQVQVGTVNTTAAQIDDAHVTIRWK